MKHARWHFIHARLQNEAGAESTAGGAAVSSSSGDDDRSLGTVADAVAELERRESERRAQRKAEKAAKAEPADDADDADDDDSEQEERRRPKREEKDERDKRRAERDEQDDDDGDDEPSDDEEDDDADDDDSGDDDDADERDDVADEPRKRDRDDEPSLEIEHEGKKYKVPAALKDALMRQADYTRKTQEVAQERQVVQSAWQQAQATAQQLQQAQATLAQFAQAALGSEPDLSLAQADPQTYLVQRGLYEQRLAQMQQLMEQGQTLTRQQQALQQQQHAEFLQRQTQHMLQVMPEMRDPAKRAAFRQQAFDVGSQYGFSPDEIGAIADHRMLLILRDLARARQQIASREKATTSVKAKLANVPPKVAKPRAGDGDNRSARNSEARRQFLKSGRSMKDVERWLKSTG